MEDNSIDYPQLYRTGGAPMPRLEALAGRGLVFENAYSQAPVCSVARSTLISGMYAPRIGAQYHRREAEVPMPAGTKMFPAYLREAGYYTANHYKEDYNITISPGTWDESSPTADYQDRAPGQPFFYVHNFGETHESSLHFPVSDTASIVTTDVPAALPLLPVHPDDTAFRFTRARYHDRHRLVDSLIGAQLDRLEAEGVLDSTIVFVYGDHGGVLPGSKGYLYETGLHVPLVVYIPEAFQHLNPYGTEQRPAAFAQFMDFGPTVLRLAGLSRVAAHDGRAFLGAGVRPVPTTQDTVYGYADRFDEKSDLVRSVRIGPYKLIRSYQPYLPDALYNGYRYRMWAYRDWLAAYRQGRLNELQARFFRPRPPILLFDVVKDPQETTDLADREEYTEVLQSLLQALNRKVVELPDLSFIPESVFLRDGVGNPVAYGQRNQKRIQRLREVADLQLLPFGEAEAGVRQALASSDPLRRYWALITASSFGTAANSLRGAAEGLFRDDAELLVRLRAAEFLGLIGAIKPQVVLTELLGQAATPVEATAVLNSMSLFHYLHPTWEWQLPADILPTDWLTTADDRPTNPARLLAYLRGQGTIR